MVNKNKTIINNKNIIQICSNLKPRRRKQPKQSNYNNPAQHLNTRDNPTLYTPLNTFPNSSSLDDQSRRVRFMEAMRDPTSTKSPYSIFDNGSNTFEREGNTQGSERAIIRPQISQGDYFSAPRALSRPPIQRFSASSPYDFNDDLSDMSSVSEQPQGLSLQRLTGQDEYEIPMYVSSDPTTHNSWFGPDMQDDNISPPQERDNSELFGISGAQYLQPETRFSPSRTIPPPSFATPFRAEPEDDDNVKALSGIKERASERKKTLDSLREGGESLEMYREDIGSKINMKLDQLKEIERRRNLVKEKRREQTPAIAETKKQPTMEEVRQLRVEQDKQVKKEKERIQKFKDFKAELESMKSSNKTDLYPGKDKAIRKKFQDLIKDEDYEFTGKEAFNKDGTRKKPNIGAITKIDTFIRFLEEGSKKHIAKLKELEAPTAVKYDEQIRNPPTTRGNIQTFQAAGGGGVGPNIASRN